MAYLLYMKSANIAELRDHLTRYLAEVEQGASVEIRRRNVPIARLVPLTESPAQRTRLGCGRGTATVLGDLTEALIDNDDWHMLRDASCP